MSHAQSSHHLEPPGNSASVTSEQATDEVCCELLDALFPRAGGTIWKAPVILKLKVTPRVQLTRQDILESQHYNIATFGLHHRTTLSTPILVRIIRDLICNDFFAHHSSRSHFDLELHLRCIVASLRLLQAHGILAGSGTLTWGFFDELYNRMTWWQNYHSGQVQGAKGTEDKIKNYNNEFLIVYARDLIVTLPSDRSVATNVATRIIAAATTLGHAVRSVGIS
jgi:hypothetical protein